jgi:hypothetical protein
MGMGVPLYDRLKASHEPQRGRRLRPLSPLRAPRGLRVPLVSRAHSEHAQDGAGDAGALVAPAKSASTRPHV